MHESRGTSVFIAITIAIFISSPSAAAAAARVEMAMQLQLPREEMVRLAGYGEEKLSSVLVMGTLLCDACPGPGPGPGSELHTSHVAGAKIAVACKRDGHGRSRNQAYGSTDDYGEFMVDLPSHLHAIPKLEDACIVRILSLPKESPCHRPVLRTITRRVRLSATRDSIRAYTSGTMKLSRGLGPPSTDECSRTREDGPETQE